MTPFPRPRATVPPLALFVVLLGALLLAGCGGAAGSPAAAPTAAPAAEIAAPAAPAPTPAAPAPTPAAAPIAGAAGGGQAQTTPVAPGAATANDPSRKIIKNADLTLEVANVGVAISQIGAVAAQSGGYVLETRTDYNRPERPEAIIHIAVPVDQFEAALERIRAAAGRVISEQASGVDVTQEFVDVQSQIANLEATEARIREFLKQAATVEEALKVNAQLTEIEGQINVLKGRINFLSRRAAYSTINVQLQQPPPPTSTPSPTSTPLPTSTPTPPPSWNPGKTADQATATLSLILQLIGNAVIWLTIVVLPLVLPVLLVVLLIRVGWRRMRRPGAPTAPPGADRPENQP